MRYLQQGCNIRVPVSLLSNTITSINNYKRGIGSRRPGNHIAGVLNVAGSISNNELAFRRCEITVSHVDGNSLFAFGSKSIGNQSQVYMFVSTLDTGTFYGFKLIFKN